ncbi:MAG: hypothetical protein BGO41_02055 [Clostridiales bacterium 38-18]|nr:MAG: hypothetical protein BGO41_02055 [Clostridiales bacterium 38-18]
MSERMNELFTLTQKAQKMEMINEEKALELYLEIFENYTPKISKTYESFIRLLEKRQRFVEAEVICSKAIELIKADEISGTLDRFAAIKERLDRKIEELAPQPIAKKKGIKLTRMHLILFATIIIIGVLLVRYTSPFEDLNVNLEGKDSLNNGDSIYGESTDSPEISYEITEAMKETATNTLLKNHDVLAADIIPQEDTLGIAIIISAGTTQDRAQELSEIYLRALAGAASATYKDLDAPTKSTLGELYDYYELVISVGTSTKEADLIAKGTKVRGAKSIYWRN